MALHRYGDFRVEVFYFDSPCIEVTHNLRYIDRPTSTLQTDRWTDSVSVAIPRYTRCIGAVKLTLVQALPTYHGPTASFQVQPSNAYFQCSLLRQSCKLLEIELPVKYSLFVYRD